MPVIDCHAHFMTAKGLGGEVFWDTISRASAQVSKRPFEYIKQRHKETFEDPDGEKYLKKADIGGVDRVIVNAVDWNLLPEYNNPVSTAEPIDEQNYRIAMVAKKHPDRVSAMFGIDPRRGTWGVKLFEKAVKEWGMVGLKLLPTTGFDVNDKYCYRFYQKALDLGVPVMIHMGSEFGGHTVKGCTVAGADEAAADFPEVTFILAHQGTGLGGPEITRLALMKHNVYLDTGAIIQRALLRGHSLEKFYKPLRFLIDFIGMPKILYGTDYPDFADTRGVQFADLIKAIKEPPEEVREGGYALTEDEVEAILWRNAAEIFKLKV